MASPHRWVRRTEPVDVEEVERRYEEWKDRGPPVGGARLTLLADRTAVRVGEEIRVLHVLERTEPGQELSVMGPKTIYGELLDGETAGPPLPPGEDALDPAEYDGAVEDAPGLDANFEATLYRFDEPGRHELVWEVNGLRSNVLVLRVEPR